jgi:hypothetical protein
MIHHFGSPHSGVNVLSIFHYLFPSQDVLRSVQCLQYLQEKERLGFLLDFYSNLVTPPQPLFGVL